jgi:hypothetical protein
MHPTGTFCNLGSLKAFNMLVFLYMQSLVEIHVFLGWKMIS